MNDPNDRPPAAIDALVVECLAAIEESGPGAIELLCARHPEHAAALRRRLDVLAATGLLDEPDRDRPAPQRIGGYEVLAELGVGGMGVVYRARQRDPEREVAIKTIRPELLASDAARRRFRREIETVARLSHPGIVPVYASGEHDGMPWFAMEQIDGATLAAILDRHGDRPHERLDGAAVRTALGDGSEFAEDALALRGNRLEVAIAIGREIAAALDHAHRAGVLHRDVKPSNVLLGRDGHARLVDFGLARSEAGVEAESVELTRSGALVGSLPYMAPEQVRGEAADRRTDVYGLAATLVEWLTGAPPHRQRHETELRAAILAGGPLALARRRPRLPADLVVVLEKALDPDRDRRYETAGEFARDLEAVLALQPIRARPAGALLRARRFARRRPAVAVLLAVTAALLVAVPSGLLVANARIRAARDLAEARFADAREAIVGLAARVGDEDLRDVPGAGPVRLDVLERSLALFERLLAGRSDDAELRLQRGLLRRQTAAVLAELGRNDDAVALRTLAETEMRALRTAPGSVGARTALELADLLIDRSTMRGEPVLELLAEAEQLLERTDGDRAVDRDAWFGNRRQLLHNRANTLRNADDPAAAQAAAEAALATARAWLDASPAEPRARFAEAEALSLRALLRHDSGQQSESNADAESATRLLEALIADDPRPRHRARLGLHLKNLAHLAFQRGDHEAAAAPARRAVELFEQLTREQPYRREWQRQLAEADEAVGLAFAGRKLIAEAVTWFARSAVALEDLLALDRADRRVALRLGLAHYNCAAALLDLERRRDALPHSARARELFDELAASGTQRAAPRYAAYATVLDRRARVALAELPDPATLARPIVERCAEDAEAWFLLSQAHADLATAGVDPAHADAAVDTLRRAIDLGFDRGDRVDTTAVFDGVRSRPDFGVQRARLDG